MRGVVFDLDGTLVDSLPDVTAALNRAFGAYGYPSVAAEHVEPAMGHGARLLVASVISAAVPDTVLDPAALDEVCARYEREYAQEPATLTAPFDDAVQALRSLHQRGIALGICTNKTTDLAGHVLTAVGLRDYITEVVGRDSTPHPKPDPRHLLAVVAGLGLDRGDVVYVGDNPVDVAVADGAGVAYRHVAWGVPVPNVQVLRHFADLADMVDAGERRRRPAEPGQAATPTTSTSTASTTPAGTTTASTTKEKANRR